MTTACQFTPLLETRAVDDRACLTATPSPSTSLWCVSPDLLMLTGLMTKVGPILRLLDRMYAGQIVMKQYCDAYGLDWSKWHPDVFQSVQRRHEALVADVQQALTLSIPEGAFFPLGIKSQILLTGEAAVVDPEALAQVQEHAIAKAEARFAEKRRQKELELVGEGVYPESPP